MEKYQKVLELLKANNGRLDGRVDETGKVVWEDGVHTLLGDVAYRLPDYISRIRRDANLQVRAIRQGRKVVAYVLVAVWDAHLDKVANPVTVVEEQSN